MLTRRGFIGSLIALATLGRLPKAKAAKTIPLMGSGIIACPMPERVVGDSFVGFDIHKVLEEKYEQAFIDRAHWMADVTERGRIDEKTLRTMRRAMKKTQFKNPDDMTAAERAELDRQNRWTLEYASCISAGPDGRLRAVTTPRPGEKGTILMGSLGGVPIYGVERFGT